MAQNFQTDAGLLIIPGAYPTFTVQAANSGIATTGVLFLVGESDQGPDATLELDINANAFGPGSMADVVAKYKSGPLVDAFSSAIAAANDPDITGSFQRAILVKTNPSSRASGSLIKFGSALYETIEAINYGKLGNLITAQVIADQLETVPTTPTFAFLPPIASTNISVRVNGGAAQPLTISAQETPDAFVTALNGLTGIDTTGGTDEAILGTGISPIAGNLQLDVVSGDMVTVTFSVPFGAIPAPGDTLWIPTTSALASVHANNAGSYMVTDASATVISATKLLDATGTPTPVTPPTSQASIPAVDNTDVMAFLAMSIHLLAGADPLPGVGKSLEIAELTSGTGLLSFLTYEYNVQTGNPVQSTWMSKALAPNVLVSAAEYIAELIVSRSTDSITESIVAGGQIGLMVGYQGTTGVLVNNDVSITITVTGGAGSSPAPLLLADYPTIGDLATYINSLPGFVASAGSASIASQASTTLDQGTFGIGSTFGTKNGRIKQDAFRFFTAVANKSGLVQLDIQAAAGLPAPMPLFFLAGGIKGATTDATFNAVIDKLQLARGNFLIPLFSRDATDDIADGLTDASSSYTIANIHDYSRAHVLTMSTLKRRRNRQAFLSIRDTFANDEAAAGNLASFRCSLTFQDVKDVKSSGGVFQFQPWMGAVKAAAVQAAGFYRPLFRKNLAISGELQAAGDFNQNDDDQMENALLAGLLPIKQDETGGFYFVSDQTTYGKDNNFVYNSIQAVYVADTVTLTIGQIMEKAFVGQSLADVSAGFALATLDSIMEDMRRLKLITASDDAPKGFKNAKITIKGGTMIVSLEIKLAGALYFIPISVLVSQVQQSAG